MNYIIKNKRFRKKFNQNELIKYLPKENRIIQFPQYSKSYYNFFNLYAKENYKLVKNNCLCGESKDILL